MSENQKAALSLLMLIGCAAALFWSAVYTLQNCEAWDYDLVERTDCRAANDRTVSCRTYKEKVWYCSRWRQSP